MALPTRPDGRNTRLTESRVRRCRSEVDAIPPRELRVLVRECIERHVNPTAFRRAARLVEQSERLMLHHIVDRAVAA